MHLGTSVTAPRAHAQARNRFNVPEKVSGTVNEKLTYHLYGHTCGKSEPHILCEVPVEAWMSFVLKQKE